MGAVTQSLSHFIASVQKGGLPKFRGKKGLTQNLVRKGGLLKRRAGTERFIRFAVENINDNLAFLIPFLFPKIIYHSEANKSALHSEANKSAFVSKLFS